MAKNIQMKDIVRTTFLKSVVNIVKLLHVTMCRANKLKSDLCAAALSGTKKKTQLKAHREKSRLV